MLKNRYFLAFIPAHAIACVVALVSFLLVGGSAQGLILVPVLVYFLLGMLMANRYPVLREESRQRWVQGTVLNGALLLLLFYLPVVISGVSTFIFERILSTDQLANSQAYSFFASQTHYLSPWAEGLLNSVSLTYRNLSGILLTLLNAVSCAVSFTLGARWSNLLRAKKD